MDTKTYNIVVADTQFLITESLKLLIQNSKEYKFIGLVEKHADLMEMLSLDEIHLLITDFNQFDYNGFENLKKIITDYPKTNILILTNHLNRIEINELTKIGIKAIITKIADEEELFMAMVSAIKNKKYYSEVVLDLLTETNNQREDAQETGHLTPSEIEIVKLIATGLTTKEIAEKKHVSFHTVMSHRKNIFRKLNINNASELLMYAVRAGIIQDIEYYI
jgi:DNA-binding NarL/FixJ family response regulator